MRMPARADGAAGVKANPPTLKAMLEAANVTQGEAARTLGVCSQTLTHWCHGRNFPRVPEMERLAELLGCSLDDVIDGVRAARKCRNR